MKKKKHIVIHIVMIATAVFFLCTFLIIVGASFQTQNDLLINGYRIIPNEWSLLSYKMILKNPTSLMRAYGVTIFTTIISTFLGVFVTATCSYAMTRKSFKLRSVLSFYIFVPMLLSGGMVASYINITQYLHLKDTIWVLILPSLVSPWYILLMKGFLSSIPDALVESAKIDGASEFKILLKMIIPLSKPAIATIALFYLLGSWNEWYASLLYINDQRLIKLQYLLMRIQSSIDFLNSAEALEHGMVQAGQEIPQAGSRMAMCILVAGPMLVIFPFFQKYFVQGLTVGSVKE